MGAKPDWFNKHNETATSPAQHIADAVIEIATVMAWGATIVLPISEALTGKPRILRPATGQGRDSEDGGEG